MPQARNQHRLERIPPSTVPSFTEALFGRGGPWVERALCAEEPFNDFHWVLETSGGVESPVASIRAMEVCRWCPVRRECLESALEETQFTIMGTWGGRTGTERRRVMSQVAAERTTPTQVFTETDDRGRVRGTTALSHHSGREWLVGPVYIKEVADRLDSSFDERFEGWILTIDGCVTELEVGGATAKIAGARHRRHRNRSSICPCTSSDVPPALR